MKRIELDLIPESEKSHLWRSLQRYLDELSRLGGDPAVDGEYPYPYFDAYWREPERQPFWIRSAGEIRGFALVRRTEEGAFEMAEFFIEPEHRRGGLGIAAAHILFARFVGRWQLSEFKENAAAIAFWRRASQGFPGFREAVAYDRVEQTFCTEPAAR